MTFVGIFLGFGSLPFW